MKRINNLYSKIYDIDNLNLADKKARKGKLKQNSIKEFDKNREENLKLLQQSIINKTYKTSEYKVFKIYEPKEREIFKLPYFPDRILHHAIMNVMEPIFISTFTKDTFSCIKKRGIHGAANAVKKSLKNKIETKYCLKLYIKKFYPNINHEILQQLIRKKIKDKDLLFLLDEIILSCKGLPIGNYLSQFFANFYLTYFDHWIKEDKKVKYYFRYADDIVILSDSKGFLHEILFQIKKYLNENLKLTVKENYQIFPIEKRGIDFVGYKFYHSHILLRNGIKQNFKKMLKYNKNQKSIDSYKGWTNHANCKNLINKLIINEKI